MPDIVIGTRVGTGCALANRSSTLYDDESTARTCWSWIRMHLEFEGRKREITAVEAVFREWDVHRAVSPASLKFVPPAESHPLPEDDTVVVPESVLQRHSLIFGASGYGKTYFAHVLIAQMLQQKCSLIAIDPKPETLRRLRGTCEQLRIPAENIVTLDPSEPDTLPGFHPLAVGDDPDETVRLFLDWMSEGDTADTPRWWMFLHNAVIVAVWHKLRPQDVLRLLDDEEYRHDVLRKPPRYDPGGTYAHAHNYFVSEYLTMQQKQNRERELSVQSVKTRFNKLSGNPTFQKMMNAPHTTVEVEKMFSEQRVLLVSTGSGGGMTRSSTNTLISYILHMVNGVAARHAGHVPVVLCMDEVGSQDAAVKEELSRLANLARERNVRLILAAQHPYQFSEQLRRDVMVSSALKAYFHNDDDGAEKVASLLAGRNSPDENSAVLPRLVPVGTPERVFQARLYAARGTSTILAPLAKTWKDNLHSDAITVDPANPGPAIKDFALLDEHAKPPICFENGTRFGTAIRGLPPGSVAVQWVYNEAWAVVWLHMMGIHRESARQGKHAGFWLETITILPAQRAVVSIGSEAPVIVDVMPLTLARDASPRYIAEMRAATAAPPYTVARLPVPPPKSQPKSQPQAASQPTTASAQAVAPATDPTVHWEDDDA